jgi:hypothetical protein
MEWNEMEMNRKEEKIIEMKCSGRQRNEMKWDEMR